MWLSSTMPIYREIQLSNSKKTHKQAAGWKSVTDPISQDPFSNGWGSNKYNYIKLAFKDKDIECHVDLTKLFNHSQYAKTQLTS